LRQKLCLMTAAEFLQREQEKAYGEITQPPVNLGMVIRQDPEALRRKLLGRQRPRSPLEEALKDEEVCASIARAAAVDLPTPYEDPFTYPMMTAYAEDIEGALARAFSIRFKTRPLMGTLPLGRANAAAIRVPFIHQFIVVFHHGLFAFVNLLAKVVAAAIPSDGSTEPATFRYEIEEIDERMRHDSVILERFTDALTSYLLDGRPRTRGQYVLAQPNRTWCDILVQSAELFALGHEYSHIIRGHLDQVETFPGSPLAEIPLSHAQEFEADQLGAILATAAMRKRRYDFTFGYCGTDFFCTAMDIVMRALSVLQNGTEDIYQSETHPPWLIRRSLLRLSIPHWVGGERARIPLYLATSIDHILTTLWGAARPTFVALRDAGARPSAIWNSGNAV
jgi:hypothetical protein